MSTQATKLGPYGGPGGNPWDINALNPPKKLVSIQIWSTNPCEGAGGVNKEGAGFINAFSFSYVDIKEQPIRSGPWGSPTGKSNVINIGEDESLITVDGTSDGEFVTSLKFVTNRGTTYGPGGGAFLDTADWSRPRQGYWFVGGGRWWQVVGTSPEEILAPVFTGAGDGGTRGCRGLSWKRCRGGAPPSPHGLGSGGKPQIHWIGRWRRLRVFLLLGGIVSEPATIESLEDDGIFAVDCGIFAAWFAEAEAGRWFLFGNDDGVERSLGRGVVFGSRFFPACPRCSSVVAGLL